MYKVTSVYQMEDGIPYYERLKDFSLNRVLDLAIKQFNTKKYFSSVRSTYTFKFFDYIQNFHQVKATIGEFPPEEFIDSDFLIRTINEKFGESLYFGVDLSRSLSRYQELFESTSRAWMAEEAENYNLRAALCEYLHLEPNIDKLIDEYETQSFFECPKATLGIMRGMDANAISEDLFDRLTDMPVLLTDTVPDIDALDSAADDFCIGTGAIFATDQANSREVVELKELLNHLMPHIMNLKFNFDREENRRFTAIHISSRFWTCYEILDSYIKKKYNK